MNYPAAITGVLSRTTGLLTKRAGWFVFLAWLLFALTIPACLAIGVGSSINLTYHPLHEGAPYDRASLQVLPIALGVALFAAVASSLALALRRREIAFYVVTACWIVLTIGSTFYLASIDKGPQQFDRYAGEQHLRIPWQYDPRGSDEPGPNGVSVRLCLDTLRGAYDASCHDSKQVTIYPLDDRRLRHVEVPRYQRSESEDQPTGIRDGHQGYVHTTPAEGQRKAITSYYYRLTNSEGSLQRTVSCYGFGSCDHRAIAGSYVLIYQAPESAFPQWNAMDQKLAVLVDSWAMQRSSKRSPDECSDIRELYRPGISLRSCGLRVAAHSSGPQ